MSIREIAQNFYNFCPKYIPPLSEFSHCFCSNLALLLPEFRVKQWEIRAKAMGNLGKSNLKIGAKAMRKLGKRQHIYISGKNFCFCPKFPLLFPESPIAFARISHSFCPNFSFSNLLEGHSAPPPPPRLLRLFFSIFCWYFRNFVGTNDIHVGLYVPTYFQMY